jgi:hypothetical protein
MAKPRPAIGWKTVTLRGSVLKRWQGASGVWRRNGQEGREQEAGMPDLSERLGSGVRVIIGAKKQGNSCGAKGGRKEDT